jgi:phosphate transport system substrate-binding protein
MHQPLLFWRNSGLVLAVALVATAVGCGKTEVVSVDGSSTVFLISAAVAETANDALPDVKVVVSQSGTGGGFKKFVAGEIDVCDASRPITDAEIESCQKAGVEFVEFEVAYDGLAVLVNPKNDWCDSLTVDQLKTIWRAEAADSITKWSDVNPDWPDLEFKLYGPGEDSGTFDYFTLAINGEEKSGRRDYSQSENDNSLVMGVAGDKGSLGYFGFGYYAANKDKLKLLPIDGGEGPIAPSPETVRDGTYEPLSRPLYIYVRKSSLAKPAVAKFIQYYLENVDQVAEKVGFVPVPDDVAEQNAAKLKAATSTLAESKTAA